MTVSIDVFPPPVPQPLHAIINRLPKPEEVPWRRSPDVWVAIATMLLAIITGSLAFYTWRLFRAAQEAHIDSDKALRVAKDQMARSLRAYVIVDGVEYREQMGDTSHIPQIVKLTITNSGQIPSHDTTVEWSALLHSLETPTQREAYDIGEQKKQLRGIIGKEQRVSIEVDFEGALINKNLMGINFGGKELILRGAITYRDGISDEVRKTDQLRVARPTRIFSAEGRNRQHHDVSRVQSPYAPATQMLPVRTAVSHERQPSWLRR